jgi:hypothetical protein
VIPRLARPEALGELLDGLDTPFKLLGKPGGCSGADCRPDLEQEVEFQLKGSGSTRRNELDLVRFENRF